jgi:hypothetical protein
MPSIVDTARKPRKGLHLTQKETPNAAGEGVEVGKDEPASEGSVAQPGAEQASSSGTVEQPADGVKPSEG